MQEFTPQPRDPESAPTPANMPQATRAAMAALQLPASRENPSWGLRHLVLLLFLALFAIFACTATVFAWAIRSPVFRGQSPLDLAHNAIVIVPAQMAAYVLIFAFMRWIVSRCTRQDFAVAVKWRWPESPTLYAVLGIALALIIQIGSQYLPIPKSLPIDQYFRHVASAYILAAFGILVAPLIEELFFRGFLYPVLERHAGLVIAVVVTALFFALIHQSQLAHAWAPLLMLFVVGMVLTLVRALKQSVAASFLVHFFYNVTLFSMLWIGTDHFRHLERIKQ